MLYVPENISKELVTRPMALAAVRQAFIAAADGNAASFPTLQGTGRDPAHRFSVKAARVNSAHLTGMKVGAYWPSSDAVGLTRGSSTVLFLDDSTGRVEAIVQTSAANAYRTSAGDALAVDLLARRDAKTVAVFGAGFQAFHEVMAIREIRPVGRVYVVNRTADRADALVGRFREAGVDASKATAQGACENSDVIVTVTASKEPLLDNAWVKPGTHLSCMGADNRGKQELPVELLRRAHLFADLVSQSTEVGEFQHVAAEIASGAVRLDALGDVATGRKPGRQSDADITIFDSSGIALQDIFFAKMILDECRRQGRVVELT
jgi:ornithine cyclodeaminase